MALDSSASASVTTTTSATTTAHDVIGNSHKDTRHHFFDPFSVLQSLNLLRNARICQTSFQVLFEHVTIEKS